MQDLCLLRRTPIWPGESLNSYLARLAKLNNYDPPGMLSEHVIGAANEPGQARDRIGLPTRVTTYEQLAMLTMMDASLLYASTTHLFASVLIPPDGIIQCINIIDESVPLLPSGIASKQLRPTQAAQFCPVCLKAAPYHRLIWTPIAVSACLEHRCLLLTHCHLCGKKVSVHDIIVAQCDTCGSNLTAAEMLSLEADEFGLFSQCLIQSWLTRNLTPRDTAILLPEQAPRVLYRIIDGLRQAIIALGNQMWPYLHKVNGIPLELTLGSEKQTLTPYESYCLYATACKGLVDWPQGFYEFLRAYKTQRKGDQPIHGGPKVDLGNFYTQWLQDYWQHPAFVFVQEAFEKYFVTNYWLSSPVIRTTVYQSNSGAAREFAHINIAEAARIMGVTPRWIELLINAGRLSSYTTSTADRLKFVNKTEVLEHRNQRSEYITRSEAAVWLGVTEKMITDMVNVGLLEAEFRPSDSFPQWLFNKSAIVKLLENLAKHIRCLSAQEESEHLLIALAEASRLVFVLGLNAASILQRIVEGKLQAYAACNDKLLLGSLLFARSDLQRCIEDMKVENDWIGREEARRLLGVKDGTLARWVKGGLLTPCATFAHVQYFHTSTILQFTADYISSDEAAQILGIGKLAVQKWVRTGRLAISCVSGPEIDGAHAYLFNKEKLQHWRGERLTFGEAAHLLKISGATLHRWVSEGKIKPLEDMGGKQRWFSKQSILELCRKVD
jgi:predicted site-specific integrase-resolvase/plasmid maintenance system antidote protein VapI